MAIKKNRIPVDNKVLAQLITTENSCVEIVRQELDMRTLPYHGKEISNAIKEQLNNLIGKYVKKLTGIVLGFKNIKVLSDVGFIDDEACLVFSISADFYVFKPVPGKELPAVVIKKSKDHIGCLVYHTFNASIPKPEGVIGWEGNNVEIAQEITFRVTSVKLDSRIPYMKGEFLKQSTVNKRIIFDECDELPLESSEPPKKKKSRKNLENIIEQEKIDSTNESFLETEHVCYDKNINISVDESLKKKRKKSSKHLENEIVLDNTFTDMDGKKLSSGEPVKKKRSRRSLENEIEGREIDSLDGPKSKKKKKC